MGLSLAAALAAAGHDVTIWGRGAERPGFLDGRDRVRYRPGPGRSDRRPSAGSTLIFCVPDDALAGVAAAWADALRDPSGGAAGSGERSVALHTAGVRGPETLEPLRAIGRPVAAWHPLTALAEPTTDAFRGVTFGLHGDGRAVRRGRELARAIGARAVELEPGAHVRYHAAAVFASNHLVSCLSVAARELAAATGGRADLDDLVPLARAALDHLAARGLPDGATGPVVRGDGGTLRRHLEALPDETAALHRRLARELLAVVGGRLDPGAAAELRDLLAETAGEEGRAADEETAGTEEGA